MAERGEDLFGSPASPLKTSTKTLDFDPPSVDRFAWLAALARSHDLPPAGRRVLEVIFLHANARDGGARLSQATLARETGLPRRTVQRALDAVSGRPIAPQKGRVQRENQPPRRAWLAVEIGRGQGGVNLYRPILTRDLHATSLDGAANTQFRATSLDGAASGVGGGEFGATSLDGAGGATSLDGAQNPDMNPEEEQKGEYHREPPSSLSGAVGRRQTDEELENFLAKFCAAYPRKSTNKRVRAALVAALAGGATFEEIARGVVAYAAERAAAVERHGQDQIKFTQLPENWLRDEGWTKQPDAPAADKAEGDAPADPKRVVWW